MQITKEVTVPEESLSPAAPGPVRLQTALNQHWLVMGRVGYHHLQIKSTTLYNPGWLESPTSDRVAAEHTASPLSIYDH